ncbi:hypothetical protein [Tateyamaria sp. SN3-11]|uniref:hypothetical protein n=1 Tax=Tateyamaria sp. SN3-11 TaxID=3092147 RepID=UPI0039EC8585
MARQLGAMLCCIAVILGTTTPSTTSARESGNWAVSALAGTLTTGSWHEAINPGKLDFADSYMLGGALSWERPIGASRFQFGVEAQLLAHVGRQDHFELNVPVVLRYVPETTRGISSVAAGLGLSYASKIPQVEIDRNGASQRLFVYWMAEVEFPLAHPDRSALIRLHHRSDGYGIFDVDAGSTGFVFGLRHRF